MAVTQRYYRNTHFPDMKTKKLADCFERAGHEFPESMAFGEGIREAERLGIDVGSLALGPESPDEES